MSNYKNKIVVAGVATILLAAAVDAAVVGATVGVVAHAICSVTDYKETCETSLARANSTDPEELIKVVFNAAVENIDDVVRNSPLLKEAAANPSTRNAYHVCMEVLETAVDDLRRSVENVHVVLDPIRANEVGENMKTWLSAVIANQETCVDAFAETSVETSGKMKAALGTARALSSNCLAMVSELKSIFAIPFINGRKLMAREPEFVRRRVLEASRMDSEGNNIVVAKDGSGQFKTIGEAIASLPKKNNESVVIRVKAGVYNEQVKIPKKVNNVKLIGDGPTKTKVTGSKSFAKGVTTYHSATFAVDAEDFLAKDIAFENTAGPQGSQAVALRVTGDKAIFHNVHIHAYQDTLYAHTYRQYYTHCSISGTVDFIFGHSLSLFQDCEFLVRKPGPNQACMVTADGRVDKRSVGGIVIQNGHITAEQAFLAAKPPHQAFLGRPWKELSTTIIMQSNIEGFINTTGWSPWAGNFALDTCYYAEYRNRGPGSDTKNRVQWKGIKKLTPQMAEKWTGGVVFGGDEWIKKAGVPYVPTMMHV